VVKVRALLCLLDLPNPAITPQPATYPCETFALRTNGQRVAVTLIAESTMAGESARSIVKETWASYSDNFPFAAVPLIAAGQVHGGLVQGIAQALWEEAVHDEAGTLVSASFVDYLVPTAADTISFDVSHNTTASLTNTLGTKGVGEAGTIASTPAVVNAVVDAIRHFGVNDVRMPCTPERIYTAIHAQDGAVSGGGATDGAAAPHFDEADTADRTDGSSL
jgi:hypothetical protein